MSQCYECVHYSTFRQCCSCSSKNAAYGRPLWESIRVSGEAQACEFFKDIDEVK